MGASGMPREWDLGLDLGTNSIGWAAMERVEGDRRILGLGVRIFDAGYLIEKAKETSVAAPRRLARLARRQTDRRMRRLRTLFRALQAHGLLPQAPSRTSAQRHEILVELDRQIVLDNASISRIAEIGPYVLRARALDVALRPHEVGRAIYHLAQRRGYWHVKGTPVDEDDGGVKVEPEAEEKPRKRRATAKKKLGKVEQGIEELRQEYLGKGCRTVGEYLATLNPRAERIRRRYSSRRMRYEEFQAIWRAQAAHHPEGMSAAAKRRIQRAIFHQRPLKSVRKFIGECELEPRQMRAPKATLDSQNFRLLQRVNDLRIVGRSEDRALGAEERQLLLAHLEHEGDLTIKGAQKLLALADGRRLKVGLGGSDDDRIPGNRTAAKLIKVIGRERWDSLSSEERDRLVEAVLTIPSADSLARFARRLSRRKSWDLTPTDVTAFRELEFEDGYLGLSRRAIRRLLPSMRDGDAYMTAARAAYPEHFSPKEPMRELPPLSEWSRDLRNPVVTRALTELRHVVNALIRLHGKPRAIRIELARDLKRSREDRMQVRRLAGRRERMRETAADLVREARGWPADARVSELDIEKALLFEELGQPAACPYCGRVISLTSLFSGEASHEVDHIIPFSRCLDDSLGNKVLGCRDCNQFKGKRTPREAWGDSPQWETIRERIDRWSWDKDPRRFKHRKFVMTAEQVKELQDAFTARQLNDTRYLSKLSREYVALLYGGIWDAEGSERVHATAGQATAYLRNGWQLNGLLGEGSLKTRDDHRHHAVDALVVALTDAAALQSLAVEASRLEGVSERRRLLRKSVELAPPWPTFPAEAREAVRQAAISHRVSRRVRGALHDETNYRPDGSTRKKPDSRKTVVPIGTGDRQRFVAPGNNHHMVIVATTNKKGVTKWAMREPVTMIEAHRRTSAKEPVVRRSDGDEASFLYSICKGDVLVATSIEGEPALLVESVSKADVQCRELRNALPGSEITAPERTRWRYRSGEAMRRDGLQKVQFDTLGTSRQWAHD